MRNTITQTLKILIASVLLSFSASYVFAFGTWSNPTAAPPGNNTDAPINTSVTHQTKKGDFSLSPGKIFTATTGNFKRLAVGSVPNVSIGNITASGRICDSVGCIGDAGGGIGGGSWTTSGSNVYRSSGNVGIGTPNPTEKLDVVGGNGIQFSSGQLKFRLGEWIDNKNDKTWTYLTRGSGTTYGSLAVGDLYVSGDQRELGNGTAAYFGGSVGIGTSGNSNAKLSVLGDTGINATGQKYGIIGAGYNPYSGVGVYGWGKEKGVQGFGDDIGVLGIGAKSTGDSVGGKFSTWSPNGYNLKLPARGNISSGVKLYITYNSLCALGDVQIHSNSSLSTPRQWISMAQYEAMLNSRTNTIRMCLNFY